MIGNGGKRPRVLMIGHYPLDRLDAAPKVRITRLRDALQAHCDLEFLSDTREGRRAPLWRLMGRVREFDAVYVESATSTATETDLLFHALCRRAGVSLGIYIRDVYPLYDYFFDASTLKNRILRVAWHVSMARYRRDASVLFFPTQGMADLFEHPNKHLLPPAGRVVEGIDRSRVEKRVIYVGGINKQYGIETLLGAMDLVVEQVPEAKLSLICPDRPHPLLDPWRDRPWLEMKHLETDALLPEMNRAMVAALPIHPTDYPSISVKLFDTLSYGVPVVATPWKEVKRFVDAHGCGRMAEPTPTEFATELIRILTHPEEGRQLGQAAQEAIRIGNTWDDRAKDLLGVLLNHETH